MSKSPTELTLAKWRKLGYLCAIVEKWNPHARIRQDLFGFGDVLCVGHDETVLIQTTTQANVHARINKIEEQGDTVAILYRSGWRVIVEGWKQVGKWQSTETEIWPVK
jgi:hypothetical protein